MRTTCLRFGVSVKKRKGDSLARDRPCLPNFRRSGSDPDHNYSRLQSYSGRTSLARRIAYPVITFRCKSFLVPSQRAQFPECCVSLVSDSLAGFLSDPLAGFVSDALPEFRCRFSLQTSFPILNPEILLRPLRATLPVPLEILSRGSCELRFRLSDGSCLLSPSGGFLLR